MTNAMAPGGQSWAGMTSKAILRGAERGTLVLVDGMPMNMNGYYNLEDIPVQTVRRIETVKGAASTLYGSDAIGGVINIITDHAPRNAVSAEGGSRDFQNYSVSLRETWNLRGEPGSVGIMGVYQNMGLQTGLSASGYGMSGSIKRTGRWEVTQGAWSLSHQHVENEYGFLKYSDTKTWARSSVTQISDYDDSKDFFRLRGAGENWQASFYGNLQQRDYLRTANANTAPKVDRNEDYFTSSFGGDTQMRFDTRWAELLGGVTFEREYYSNKNRVNNGYDHARRENGSLFLRASRSFEGDWTASVGARESYFSSGDLTAFTPQFQIMKKLGHGFGAYANVGRSFHMPSLKQLYDESGIFTGGNADLDPEQGWNYEAGIKWEGANTLARVSVYYMDFDSISYVYNVADDRNYPVNTPFRNTGVELSLRQKLGAHWIVETGGSYSNPEEKSQAGNAWTLKYGRTQANALVRWQYKRVFASGGLAYLGDRPYWKAQAMTTFRAGLDLSRFGRLTCNVDNVLNRRDVTTHTSTAYYAAPRSYRIGYEKSF